MRRRFIDRQAQRLSTDVVLISPRPWLQCVLAAAPTRALPLALDEFGLAFTCCSSW